MKNHFSLIFGKEPLNPINRTTQINELIDDFLSEAPSSQVYMITGVCGSGKTVALTTLSNTFREKNDWIVLDLNPERDLLQAMGAELCNRKNLIEIFKAANLNLSIFGIGFNIPGEPPISDVVVALEKMLAELTRKGKKILITIDEVSNSRFLREFISQYQIFVRKNFNVFLLMTGLYENIYELQNEKTLTFLYRAPKLELKPLNIVLIAEKYKEIFNLDDQKALEMAKVTKGYPFAFQVLGYLCFKNKIAWEKALPEFDACLEEYVYEKIWSELSEKDREILMVMCTTNETKINKIREGDNITSGTFSVYRKRLIKKGIIYAPNYGYLDFILPRFREFVLRNID